MTDERVPATGGPRRTVRRDGTIHESWGKSETGRSAHRPGCSCQRCRGFEAGNELSTTHGAYGAVARLTPRAREWADATVAEMEREGIWRPLFVTAVMQYAICLVRQERADEALAAAEGSDVGDGDRLRRLREDSRRWSNAARGWANDLGLTPTALARIARDTGIGRATRSAAALQALGDHVEREHGEPEQ